MLLMLLFYFFLFIIAIQLFFYFGIFNQKLSTKTISTDAKNSPVSIIVAAKNEEATIYRLLLALMAQNYHTFEVILINDASTDETLKIMKSFEKQHRNIKIIDLAALDNYTGNKKNALTKGIAMAQYDYLLFTDADCVPASKNWISSMAGHFTKTTSIVLGYGAYQKIEASLLNKIIRYETLITAIQYLSYAKCGMPYMGVGRNLAYKKEHFNQVEGYKKHDHIKSGDDDLLIKEIANSKNTTICVLKDSFTVSQPKKTFLNWFKQKKRHLSTAHFYKPFHKQLLGLFYFSQFLFWSLAIILLVLSFKWQLVIILIAIRLIAQLMVFKKFANTLDEKDLILFFPLLDFLNVYFQMLIFISNLIEKPKTW